MENQLNEQTTITAQPAEAETNFGATEEGAVSFGKFKDVNALLKAYNSLQAEFTKRCQRVKELEGALASFDKREKDQAVSTEKKSALSDIASAKHDAENLQSQDKGLSSKEEMATKEKSTSSNEEMALKEQKTSKEQPLMSKESVLKASEKVFESADDGLQSDKTLPNENGAGENNFANTEHDKIAFKDEKEVLKEYLKSVLTGKPTAIIMDGGVGLKTLPKSPKTISEAGAFALELLNNQNI